MKKIVFVIESLSLGGAEKSLVTLLQNLDYTLYAVDLIVFNKGGLFEKSVPKEVTIINSEFPKLNSIERVDYKIKRVFNRKALHQAQLLWSIIQNKFQPQLKKYDVAIAYNQGFATYYTNKYIIATFKYAWLNTDYKNAGYKIENDYAIYKNYNAIVAVSAEAKIAFDNELKRIHEKLRIDIIKDISDKKVIVEKSNEAANINFGKETINIVTVGRLAKPKSLHLAIESCKKLIDKGYDLHWYVVGEGSERVTLEQLIVQNELNNNFTLIGATDNPYPYMKNCDIYVQTSLFEGLGLTVIEASYLNKPIVCTNFPTAYTILKDNETGLIALMNSDSIVSKMELLINDDALKNKLITNLSQLENADKEQTLKQFEKLMI